MEKRKANTDVTYCTNKKCKFKNICERNIEHYDFNSKLLYWFGEFNELECEKKEGVRWRSVSTVIISLV